MKYEKQTRRNMNNPQNPKSEISHVINSNLVNGELDVVGALSDIFNKECSVAVLKGIENKQNLIDFMSWLNEKEQLGFTSIGIERIVDRYING